MTTQWIEKIYLLNQLVSIVKNAVEREHVKYPEVKSTKTVLDTMFYLWTIVEEKLTQMMAPVPFCQGTHDAWTKIVPISLVCMPLSCVR